ncbi:hypothetical protein LXL04_013777 [Taraxacum kok-saghyz]
MASLGVKRITFKYTVSDHIIHRTGPYRNEPTLRTRNTKCREPRTVPYLVPRTVPRVKRITFKYTVSDHIIHRTGPYRNEPSTPRTSRAAAGETRGYEGCWVVNVKLLH